MELCFTHTVLFPKQKLLIFFAEHPELSFIPTENMATLRCLCVCTYLFFGSLIFAM